MATVQHSTLSSTEIHEPKGADTALENQVYLSDGSGSGSWTYWPTGWASYTAASGAQNFTTTAAKLIIDGTGTSIETHLPSEIRGSGSLWNTGTSEIKPIAVGDAYTLRLDLPVTARTTATFLTVGIDIGGGATPTNYINETRIDCDRSTPFDLSVSIPIYTLNTFVTNGGQIFIVTNSGDLDIDQPRILITRTHGANF